MSYFELLWIIQLFLIACFFFQITVNVLLYMPNVSEYGNI